MKNPLTNHILFSTDWAAADRQAFIRSVPKARRQKDRDIAPGLATRGVWMRVHRLSPDYCQPANEPAADTHHPHKHSTKEQHHHAQ